MCEQDNDKHRDSIQIPLVISSHPHLASHPGGPDIHVSDIVNVEWKTPLICSAKLKRSSCMQGGYPYNLLAASKQILPFGFARQYDFHYYRWLCYSRLHVCGLFARWRFMQRILFTMYIVHYWQKLLLNVLCCIVIYPWIEALSI